MSDTGKLPRAALDTALERLALLGALSTRASRRKAVTAPKMALGARVAARRFLKTFHAITDAPPPDISITPKGGVTLAWQGHGSAEPMRNAPSDQIVVAIDGDGLCDFLVIGATTQVLDTRIPPDRALAKRIKTCAETLD